MTWLRTRCRKRLKRLLPGSFREQLCRGRWARGWSGRCSGPACGPGKGARTQREAAGSPTWQQGALRAQAPLGNLLTQEVRPHRAELGAGLWGKPSALLEEVDTPSCVLKAKMEGEDGQQSAEGPRTAGVREARE